MVSYYTLGSGKQLNEIVMAGSHDAAITKGSGNAQTQNLDIFHQAKAGVRIFDIRITGASVKKGGAGEVATLRAYHGTNLKAGGTRTVVDVRTNQSGAMKIKPMVLGTYGLALTKILADAARFVDYAPNEFVILKFDKCQNWPQIAEACVDMLGDKICTLRGSLNTRTLQELRGKVIVLFSVSGREAVGWQDAAARGILAFQNLDKGGGFDGKFDGLQYFGKGGTNAFAFWRSDKKKMVENIKKQSKLMQKGAATDPKVLGMVYWTATGLNASIKNRNDFLWNDENEMRLMDLWATRVPQNIDQTKMSSGPVLKEFMPNFVMIDFANKDRCETIFSLNQVAAVRMTGAAKRFYEAA